MQILPTNFPLSTPNPKPSYNLASINAISTLSLLPKLSSLSLIHNQLPPSSIIRMGGGPRTFPGGVSKWQWKRMQAKKAKQLLKARLARERQIYEMRKRAELKAAVSNLERPWEVVQKGALKTSSSLFSVSADEQLKVLADRFQKPGGFDLWSENDGPQIFHTPDGNLPSSRFFPKGVVHSIKPYGQIDEGKGEKSSINRSLKDGNGKKLGNGGGKNDENFLGLKEGRRKMNSSSKSKGRYYDRRRNSEQVREFRSSSNGGDHVYDMSLQGDGSYEFSAVQNDDDNGGKLGF
ncbi:unnamed protein product [Amaranthus hypochondriacus]